MASTCTCINMNCENGEWRGGVRILKLILMCYTCNCTFSLVISVINLKYIAQTLDDIYRCDSEV